MVAVATVVAVAFATVVAAAVMAVFAKEKLRTAINNSRVICCH